ncbi:gamma-mobile-trio protein GmtX [Cupriavidus necator]|uniref:gamma-mobile-trio protein GmtX n=1 Tax=Cupriavidus necator TaxID=106590 RepID=UPI00339D4392
MMPTATVHPDAVLESLLAKGGRSQRQRNLKAVHGICHRQHQAGVRDFSTAGIGKLCEAAGVLKGRALYNAQSADYRTLIEAWAVYAGPAMPKATKVPASHEYLLRIEDPAIRSLMQSIIVERDKLKAQINTLKANTKVVIDRRPRGAQVVAAQGCATPLTGLTAESELTDSERQALRRAVAPQFLRDQGWRELEHGEIVNEKGRTVFDPGYATAIRKVLGS